MSNYLLLMSSHNRLLSHKPLTQLSSYGVSSFVHIDIYDSYSHSDHEQLNPLYAACNKGCLIRASTCIIAKPNIQYLNIHIC